MDKTIKNLHSIHFRWAMRRLNKMIPKSFVPEKNKLEVWNDLKILNLNDNKVEVGMLVGNVKEEKISDGETTSYILPDYNWVFAWDEFETRCENKKINIDFSPGKIEESIKTNLPRLCQLLGLDTIKDGQKIALCKMTVKVKDLFRPSYNPMVSEKSFLKKDGKYTLGWPSNCNFTLEQQDEIEDWLAHLQANNEYPWTRMGYTYDCAAGEGQRNKDGSAAYIGLSEFILMPNSTVENVKLYPEKSGLWDYSSSAQNS